MADTTSNITIQTVGTTADLGTDYGTNIVGASSAHLQMMKVIWGDKDSGYRVSGTYPLPVSIYGAPSDVGISGGKIAGTGNFYIANAHIFGGSAGNTVMYLAVAGDTLGNPVGITGTIQGFSGAYPVAVTGDVLILSDTLQRAPRVQGITNGTPLEITGGNKLNYATDSVQVIGSTVGFARLAPATDSIAVYGADLGTKVLTKLFAGDGATIGHSGDAMNVNVVNAGLTLMVSVGATIGITNESNNAGGVNPLQIQGSSGASVIVKGEQGGALEVVTGTGNILNVTLAGTKRVDINDSLLATSLTGGSVFDTKLNTLINQLSGEGLGFTGLGSALTGGTQDFENHGASGANVVLTTVTRQVKPSAVYFGTIVAPVGSDGATTMAGGNINGSSGANSIRLHTGVNVKASPFNSDYVYIAGTGGADAVVSGYPLEASETLFVECNDLNKVYVFTNSTTAQNVYFHGS
tara:strand:+ start:628 stop:2022 length:1395 start_codon:yes stop_codon:yes gene_type:complete